MAVFCKIGYLDIMCNQMGHGLFALCHPIMLKNWSKNWQIQCTIKSKKCQTMIVLVFLQNNFLFVSEKVFLMLLIKSDLCNRKHWKVYLWLFAMKMEVWKFDISQFALLLVVCNFMSKNNIHFVCCVQQMPAGCVSHMTFAHKNAIENL